jgi:hypothetical protein
VAQGRTYLHSTKDVNCEEPRREFPLGEIIVLNRGEGALDHNRAVEQHTQPCNLGRVEPSTPVQATPSQHTREPLPSPRCPTPAYFRPLHGQSVLRAKIQRETPNREGGRDGRRSGQVGCGYVLAPVQQRLRRHHLHGVTRRFRAWRPNHPSRHSLLFRFYEISEKDQKDHCDSLQPVMKGCGPRPTTQGNKL